MLRKYFRCWNPTFGDLRNTETASEQACGGKERRPDVAGTCVPDKARRAAAPVRQPIATSGLSTACTGGKATPIRMSMANACDDPIAFDHTKKLWACWPADVAA
jgi:hypothetical protein